MPNKNEIESAKEFITRLDINDILDGPQSTLEMQIKLRDIAVLRVAMELCNLADHIARQRIATLIAQKERELNNQPEGK